MGLAGASWVRARLLGELSCTETGWLEGMNPDPAFPDPAALRPWVHPSGGDAPARLSLESS